MYTNFFSFKTNTLHLRRGLRSSQWKTIITTCEPRLTLSFRYFVVNIKACAREIFRKMINRYWVPSGTLWETWYCQPASCWRFCNSVTAPTRVMARLQCSLQSAGAGGAFSCQPAYIFIHLPPSRDVFSGREAIISRCLMCTPTPHQHFIWSPLPVHTPMPHSILRVRWLLR